MERLFILLFILICNCGFSQDSPIIRVQGFMPKGIFSVPQKLVLESNTEFSITAGRESEVLLTTEPMIFHEKEELLKDVGTYWASEALNTKISLFKHDVFTLSIQIFKGNYQMKFEWNSDVLPEQQVIIEPVSAYLKVNSNKFIKGNTVTGYLDFNAICKGGEFDNTKIHAKGRFKFVVP